MAELCGPTRKFHAQCDILLLVAHLEDSQIPLGICQHFVGIGEPLSTAAMRIALPFKHCVLMPKSAQSNLMKKSLLLSIGRVLPSRFLHR